MAIVRQTCERDEVLALQALGFLAEEPDRLASFMAASGLTQDTLMAGAGDARLQAAVLDYLMTDESLLMVFCTHKGIDPREPGRALQRLNGHTAGS